jgi:hypothetical protein
MGRQADLSLRDFAKSWFTTVQELLDKAQLRPHPLRMMEGGFPGVLEGLDMLRKKQVSGVKLVYSIP